MMNKKGSLNLSINAIVVLILAITMLGLGLTFMKTMFGKVTTQFEDISSELENEVIKKLESSSSRLEFNKYLVEMKRGETKSLYYGIYNNLAAEETFTVTAECDDAIKTVSKPLDIVLSTFPTQSIDLNKAKVSPLKVSIDSNQGIDTYACQIKIMYDRLDGATTTPTVYSKKDFTIRVV